MIRSMTGFGAATSDAAPGVPGGFGVEIRSVNSRFLDVKVGLPLRHARLEPVVVAHVRRSVARGRIDLTVRERGPVDSGAVPRVDLALARRYRDALVALRDGLGLTGEIDLRLIAEARDVLVPDEASVDLDALWDCLRPALDGALAALVAMREREGAVCRSDLSAHLAALEGEVARVSTRVPDAVAAARARLASRLDAALAGTRTRLDPARLEQEVALLADRSDVTEELERLRAHIHRFRELLEGASAETEPVGRKLDFLLQEMGREANTLGAKAADATIAALVVDVKTHIERLREQVQNIE